MLAVDSSSVWFIHFGPRVRSMVASLLYLLVAAAAAAAPKKAGKPRHNPARLPLLLLHYK